MIKSSSMSLDVFHFETLSKTVYSHGLESIYALETVDIKTLKRMEEPKKVTPVHKVQVATFARELPFEDRFRETLPSTRLSLPIECLELSKPLIVRLKERGIGNLFELREIKDKILSDRSLGQNFIDELRRCFETTFEGKELDFVQTIDWISFLKGAVFPIDKRGAYLLLKEVGLEEVVQIPLSLKLSVKTISEVLKGELIEEAKRSLQTLSLTPFFDVFVIPWMRGRHGIATRGEIIERLSCVADEGEIAKLIVPFLCEKTSTFEKNLKKVMGDLLTIDSAALSKIQEIEALSKSYFYAPQIIYPLEQLVSCLLKDLAERFIFASHGEVEAVLKNLDVFRVRRDQNQALICHLA